MPAATPLGQVALTFDDGPCPELTTALLDALTAVGARATMFNIGTRARRRPALVRAQQAAGMWIGNHTWSHPHLSRLTPPEVAAEIAETQETLTALTGARPTLFRPPYGETDPGIGSIVAEHDLREVLWTVDSKDWDGADTEQIVRAARSLQPGGVMLLHDGNWATVKAVPRIVAELADRGLEPGAISATTGRAVAAD